VAGFANRLQVLFVVRAAKGLWNYVVYLVSLPMIAIC
jgi:hypothetical protein